MEIEIIRISQDDPLTPTKNFGIVLNRILSTIKMLHWYSKIYNVHTILGDLYDGLSDSFDELQEEIIGTSTKTQLKFPNYKLEYNYDEMFDAYVDDQTLITHYYSTINVIVEILNSFEFDAYVKESKSGINNTKEEILSQINKANYLLSMVIIGVKYNEN